MGHFYLPLFQSRGKINCRAGGGEGEGGVVEGGGEGNVVDGTPIEVPARPNCFSTCQLEGITGELCK